MRFLQVFLGLAVAGFLVISGACAGDGSGSAARQITPANMTNLQIAWARTS